MKAHPESVAYPNGPASWRDTTCDWCGSCKPDILAKAIREDGATLSEADRKYGWPHKYYIKGMKVKLPGAQKFYSVHLQDATIEDRETIEKVIGLNFDFFGNSVSWRRIE